MGMSDTTPEAAALQTAIHRRLGEDGRFRLAVEITDLVWACARAQGRGRQPDVREPGGWATLHTSSLAYHRGAVSVRELFIRIRAALEAAEIPHMLTGSFAGSIHGAPRATQDIDIVIAPTREQLVTPLTHFPKLVI